MKYAKLVVFLAGITTAFNFAIAKEENRVVESVPVAAPEALSADDEEVITRQRADLAASTAKYAREQALAEANRATALAQAATARREAELTASAEQFAKEQALEDVQREIALAQIKADDIDVDVNVVTPMAAFGQRGGKRALVIPKDPSDVKIIAETEEDLKVMAHILDKAASSDEKSARAMGIVLFSKFSGGAPQNLYIEGTGAILFLNVNYPLMPPPAKDADSAKKEKTTDEWEQARNEIDRPGPPGHAAYPFAHALERYNAVVSGEPAVVDYDADKVEDLKSGLISALKNAAHIRQLKPDETVTVVVMGAGAGVTKKTAGATYPAGPGVAKRERVVVTKFAGGGAQENAPAKLVIRARKADCEALRNGHLSLDEFRKKAAVMLY